MLLRGRYRMGIRRPDKLVTVMAMRERITHFCAADKDTTACAVGAVGCFNGGDAFLWDSFRSPEVCGCEKGDLQTLVSWSEGRRWATFSSKVSSASFSFAAERVSLRYCIFCGGLHGEENSVSGVEGVFDSFIAMYCQI